MTDITSSEARKALSDVLNRVAFGGDRVTIVRRGKRMAVLTSMEDAALLEEIEDQMDVPAARKALKEEGSLSLEEVKAELEP